MDPNETLAALRRALSEHHTLADRDVSDQAVLAAAEVALRHFETLDEWLSKGGFLPDAWVLAEPKDDPAADREAEEVVSRLVAPRGYERIEPLGGPHPGVNGSVLPGDEA